MISVVKNRGSISGIGRRAASGALALAVVLVPAVVATRSAQAQTFSVLHSFTGAEGGNPDAGLIRDASGNLYGTTPKGGAHGLGTVFKLATTGKETVLHSFSGPDGKNPFGKPAPNPNRRLRVPGLVGRSSVTVRSPALSSPVSRGRGPATKACLHALQNQESADCSGIEKMLTYYEADQPGPGWDGPALTMRLFVAKLEGPVAAIDASLSLVSGRYQSP